MAELKEDLNKCVSAYADSFDYSDENKLILSWYAKRILKKAHSGAVLDLGLGHGYTTKIFSKAFSDYTVIDGSPEIVKIFKENNPDVQAHVEISYFEDFMTDRRYDLIIFGFILEHVDDPVFILKKYKQFLKPGGQVFVAVPNATALNKRLGYEAGLISDMFALSNSDIQLGHKRLFSKDSLLALASESGYALKSLEGIFLKPITTSQMKNLNISDNIFHAMMLVGIDYPELSVGLLAELEALP